MADDRGRIERLVQSGKLTAAEAEQLRKAADKIHRRSEGKGEPMPSRFSLFAQPKNELQVRYLWGSLDREGFLKGHKDLAVRMGIQFGALMTLFNVLPGQLDGSLSWESLMRRLVLGVCGGALFGFAMYRLALLPSAKDFLAKAEEQN